MNHPKRTRIKVFIAEDSPETRYGIAMNLASTDEFEILPPGVTDLQKANHLPCDIPDTLKLIRDNKPDVVVMDIKWGPNLFAGIEAARQIKDDLPACRVVLYSNYVDRERVVRAVLEGQVDGYIPKEGYPSYMLPEAIRTVYKGLPYFVPEVVQRLLSIISNPAGATFVGDRNELLNETELKVLKHIARGESNSTIAGDIGYAEGAIKGIVRKIYINLGIHEEYPKGNVDLRVMAILKGLELGYLNFSDLVPRRLS
jgi:DNA-binding NarL/FixJ family response regulator